jgi:antitoxin HicB
MNEEYIGSNFDDFLTEEGLLEEAVAVAIKRILAFQIKELIES